MSQSGRDVTRMQLIASVCVLAQQASHNGDYRLSRMLIRAVECAAVEASEAGAKVMKNEARDA